ncbi:hypothetical protein C1645_732405 [Glomus cerebriforme]|uniref:SRA1/Sec31 domain-containing protein n=1 Tax=Glomus cerebriforme TaxID=658196 RepID=A0A397TJ91_9GLOM|nr:hypothetical protein C1645_732405 [Glomus cerebriforme]
MASTKVATKLTDFRTATITQHWNDPPQKIFNKYEHDHKQLDSSQICSTLQSTLKFCKENAKNSDRKIIIDTEKRLENLYERLEKNEISESALGKLGKLCEYLELNDLNNAITIHENLMITDFDKEGKWLLGIKRLLDLYKKNN